MRSNFLFAGLLKGSAEQCRITGEVSGSQSMQSLLELSSIMKGIASAGSVELDLRDNLV